jgi:signal transduction histidine kinase
LSIRSELTLIDEVRGIALYRLVQEALTNVARHAQASEIDIDIALDPGGGHLQVQISDNGRGMVPLVTSKGLGLVGMRERIAALGGSIEAGNASRGFRVRAILPVRSD